MSRAREVDPLTRDRIVAAALVSVLALAAVVEAHGTRETLVSLAGAVALGAPHAWRRAAPAGTAVAVALAAVLEPLLGGALVTESWTPLLAVALGLFTLGALARGRGLLLGAPAAFVLVGLAAGLAADGEDVAGAVAFGLLFVVAPSFAAGRAVRHRTALTATLAERAQSLEAEREERARRAREAERARIAGELHDVVAHSVSSMVVQAAAARRLASRDPALARQAIVAVEDTGREALHEMRSLLGVLRRGDEGLALAPPPGLARLDTLLARGREDGLTLGLSVEGEPVRLTPGLDAAAFRVLEESLAALRPEHGAELVVRWRPRELVLDVYADGGPPVDEDAALLGLRRRVALFEGELESSRRRDGHALRTRLPLAEPR